MASNRVRWGRVVAAFVRAGWRPPPPDDRVLDELLRDMRRVDMPRGFLATPTLELTEKQRRTLQLMSDGATSVEAAKLEGVRVDSIKVRLDYARQKLGAKTSTHAVAIALREGLID